MVEGQATLCYDTLLQQSPQLNQTKTCDNPAPAPGDLDAPGDNLAPGAYCVGAAWEMLDCAEDSPNCPSKHCTSGSLCPDRMFLTRSEDKKAYGMAITIMLCRLNIKQQKAQSFMRHLIISPP